MLFFNSFSQSMSDESSIGSPRIKTPDLKTKPVRGQVPWWAEEDDEDDNDKREATRQSWLKPKKPEAKEREELKHQDQDAVDNVRRLCSELFFKNGY